MNPRTLGQIYPSIRFNYFSCRLKAATRKFCHVGDNQFVNRRDQLFHFSPVRFSVGINREHNVKSICIFCIEIMSIVEFPSVSSFVASRSHKDGGILRKRFCMYNRHMIIRAKFIVAILCRAEHIYCRRVGREDIDIIADERRYACLCFTGRDKWQETCYTVLTFKAFATG